MNATEILFNQPFGDTPLFKNQLDLVTQLLNNNNSPYYYEQTQPEQYNKALGRLRTYVSQVLSPTVTRNLTGDFMKGLQILLSNKVGEEKAGELVDIISKDIARKNASIIKQQTRGSIHEQFYSDFSTANYIAIITSKPFEVELDDNMQKASLRKALTKDFLSTLVDQEKDFKMYRFNFPKESSAILLWKGLKKIIIHHLRDIIKKDPQIFDKLYSKFTLRTNTKKKIDEDEGYKEEQLNEIVNEILQSLNRNKFIMAFVCEAPIYSIPVVAMNPSETKSSKLYALLDPENIETNLYKYSTEEILLWRLFVWDQLKSKAYGGRNIEFDSSMV